MLNPTKFTLRDILALKTQLSAQELMVAEVSCRAGNAEVCGNLGVMYREGKGVTKNLKKSSDYFKKSVQGESK